MGKNGKGREEWEGREKEEGKEGRQEGERRAGGAFQQIKIYDYTPDCLANEVTKYCFRLLYVPANVII